VGFYALCSHSIHYEALPADQSKGLPLIDVPTVLVGQLAIDRTVQGQGLGRLLLVDALMRCATLAGQIGARAVEVHAIDESAKAFYAGFGFVPLEDDPHHLLLSMETVRKLRLTSD
jgi:GNAT superfamily N-acetyltransferase